MKVVTKADLADPDFDPVLYGVVVSHSQKPIKISVPSIPLSKIGLLIKAVEKEVRKLK